MLRPRFFPISFNARAHLVSPRRAGSYSGRHTRRPRLGMPGARRGAHSAEVLNTFHASDGRRALVYATTIRSAWHEFFRVLLECFALAMGGSVLPPGTLGMLVPRRPCLLGRRPVGRRSPSCCDTFRAIQPYHSDRAMPHVDRKLGCPSSSQPLLVVSHFSWLVSVVVLLARGVV